MDWLYWDRVCVPPQPPVPVLQIVLCLHLCYWFRSPQQRPGQLRKVQLNECSMTEVPLCSSSSPSSSPPTDLRLIMLQPSNSCYEAPGWFSGHQQVCKMEQSCRTDSGKAAASSSSSFFFSLMVCGVLVPILPWFCRCCGDVRNRWKPSL